MKSNDLLMVVDSGNSRLKWQGQFKSGRVSSGDVAVSDINNLSFRWKMLDKPDRLLIANVAGSAVEAQLIEICHELWGLTPFFIKATSVSCGVTNCYDEPDKLGADRWASLIGAHNIYRKDCLIASLGTATTIDTLYSDGRFLGGIILPGFDLMKSSLSKTVPSLSVPDGRIVQLPRNTPDAISTGILIAVLGAVKELRSQITCQRGVEPKVIFCGGHARRIAGAFKEQSVMHQHLVIDGLLKIGQLR
ncbi:MAG: hypothetical protein CMK56_00645 [Proteobacteria bacterium]|nr:hypothetical protein [Pseudomonadota bacterium]